MIYCGPGFSLSYDLAPPPPLPVNKLDRGDTRRLRKKDNLLPGPGDGEGLVKSLGRGESLVLYKSFKILCFTSEKISSPLQWQRTRPRLFSIEKYMVLSVSQLMETISTVDIEGTLRRMFVTKTIDEVFKSLTNTKSCPEKTFIQNSFLVQFR